MQMSLGNQSVRASGEFDVTACKLGAGQPSNSHPMIYCLRHMYEWGSATSDLFRYCFGGGDFFSMQIKKRISLKMLTVLVWCEIKVRRWKLYITI